VIKKGAYSSTLARGLNDLIKKKFEDPAIKKKLLRKLGRSLVDHIIYEGRKDLARAGKSARGKPVADGGGLGESFFSTVSYRIKGKSTIEVYSDWDWLETLIQGMPKSKMSSLVASRNTNLWRNGKNGKVRKTLPISDGKGGVVFRVAPLNLEDAWVHPGISKHTFWNRGIAKWRRNAPKIISNFISRNMK
tara:strand:- start:154 stop:726 length:573 start_codon:yes stop_codon:yes gene_type:complete